MKNSNLLARIQLIKDEIIKLKDELNNDIIYMIKDSWNNEESIFYVHKVEGIVSDLKIIISFCDELQSRM